MGGRRGEKTTLVGFACFPREQRVEEFVITNLDTGVTRLAASPRGDAVYAATKERTIVEVQLGTTLSNLRGAGRVEVDTRVVAGLDATAYALGVAPKSGHLVFGGADKTLWVSDPSRKRSPPRWLVTRESWIYDVCFSPGGERAFFCSGDGVLRSVSLPDARGIRGSRDVSVHGRADSLILTAATTPGGKNVVFSGGDASVRLVPASPGEKGSGAVLGNAEGQVEALDVPPAGGYAFVGGVDRKLRRFSLVEREVGPGEVLATYPGTIREVATSPTGRCVAFVGKGGTPFVLDLRTGEVLEGVRGGGDAFGLVLVS